MPQSDIFTVFKIHGQIFVWVPYFQTNPSTSQKSLNQQCLVVVGNDENNEMLQLLGEVYTLEKYHKSMVDGLMVYGMMRAIKK